MAEHNKIGTIGENIATRFLMKQGFSIVERNYRKKWGEIDIIALKNKELHFIEVKSISCRDLDYVTRVTKNHRPEENVHFRKRQRLGRAIETYLLEKYKKTDVEWVFDVIAVYISLKDKKTKIHLMEGIVL